MYTFNLPPFSITLHVTAGKKVKKWVFKKFNLDEEDQKLFEAQAVAVSHGDDFGVWFHQSLLTASVKDFSLVELTNLAAHEATHTVDQLFSLIGERGETTELRAYYTGYITMHYVEGFLQERDKYLNKRQA